jgi:hypothetical protein
MFGKLFEQTFTGSMFGKKPIVFAVWAYIIAHMRPTKADGNCYCEVNPAVLAAIFSTTPGEVEGALKELESPDEASRGSAEDGRRIVIVGEPRSAGPRQYRVVNGARYRATTDEDDRRAQNREAKVRQRERENVGAESSAFVKKRQQPSASVSKGKRRSPHVSSREPRSAQAEGQADGEGEAGAESHAETEVRANRETSTTVGVAADVAFVHDVLTEVAPHLRGTTDDVAQWLAIFPDAPWVAAAICESEHSLREGRYPGYVLGMLRNKSDDGSNAAYSGDPLGFVACRLASRRRQAAGPISTC